MNISVIVKQHFFLIILVLIGISLRFYNLLWGAPYFFHPDERNIIYGISQLSFPSQMNPHFFAYGSLPIYIVYFTSLAISTVTHRVNDFTFMIFWLRFFSALLSTGIILSLYFIGTKLWNKNVGLLSAFLATCSVGFIQFAHFGTFEIWTTFFSLWLFYFSVLLVKHFTMRNLLIAALFSGILLSIKVSNLVLLIFPLVCTTLFFFKTKSKDVLQYIQVLVLYALCVSVIYFLTNPFALLNFTEFYNSIHYESSVALGSLPVFYTESFFNTTPVLFQFFKIYPFLINPFTTILFIISFGWILFKKTAEKHLVSLLLLIYFLLLFFSQAFLFVKWTRYMLPTIGYIYLMIALWVEHFSKRVKVLLYVSIVLVSLIFSFSYAKTVYFSPDTRIAAAQWTQRHVAEAKQTITEPYDLGILPFNNLFPNITQIPVYDMDINPQSFSIVEQNFSDANLFIIPSQRLIHSQLSNTTLFPLSSMFYTNLLNNKTAYQKMYETPCDIFCRITYMNDPVFNVEETATVFDRPTVMIFEKK